MNRREDNFDQVRRLLGCKRYEQPPPGYFVSFSDKIIARIEAEETTEYSSWWSWLFERFDAKPVLVCAYGLAVSGLLFMGFRLSKAFDAEAAMTPTLSGPWLAGTPVSPLSLPQEFSSEGWVNSSAGHGAVSSSKLVFRDDTGRLFFPASGHHVQPVSFTLGAH